MQERYISGPKNNSLVQRNSLEVSIRLYLEFMTHIIVGDVPVILLWLVKVKINNVIVYVNLAFFILYLIGRISDILLLDYLSRRLELLKQLNINRCVKSSTKCHLIKPQIIATAYSMADLFYFYRHLSVPYSQSGIFRKTDSCCIWKVSLYRTKIIQIDKCHHAFRCLCLLKSVIVCDTCPLADCQTDIAKMMLSDKIKMIV